jgi:hypothetical protein
MRLRTLIALFVLAGLAACGTQSADLFAVDRAGSIPGARLSLVVSDGGTVRCDGRAPVDISDRELLDARDLQRDLETPAKDALRLPAGRGSVLQYRVRTPDGSVAFADDSPRKPAALDRLMLFVRQIAQARCGRSR